MILFIYFHREGERKEKEGERNNVWLPLTCPLPTPGTRPSAQACAWLGIKPVNLWFAGPHSIHWATPARVKLDFKDLCSFFSCSYFWTIIYLWDPMYIYAFESVYMYICVCKSGRIILFTWIHSLVLSWQELLKCARKVSTSKP